MFFIVIINPLDVFEHVFLFSTAIFKKYTFQNKLQTVPLTIFKTLHLLLQQLYLVSLVKMNFFAQTKVLSVLVFVKMVVVI